MAQCTLLAALTTRGNARLAAQIRPLQTVKSSWPVRRRTSTIRNVRGSIPPTSWSPVFEIPIQPRRFPAWAERQLTMHGFRQGASLGCAPSRRLLPVDGSIQAVDCQRWIAHAMSITR